MTNFDALNRQTREYNNGITRSINPTNGGKYGTSEYWQNYWNNKTYKNNNGQYSNYYSYR